ncbi:MAG: CPBP family intramembrane glutamic endopeptidase [Planctomycetota bacterium]
MSARRARFDVALILALSVGYVACELAAVPKRWTYIGIAVALLLYLSVVVGWRREELVALGLGRAGLRASIRATAWFSGVAAVGLVVWALVLGRAPRTSELMWMLPLYPLFGLVQQLAVQGMLHRGLLSLGVPSLPAILVTTVAFAALHVGNATLVGLTFVAGLAWSVIYARHRNLWPLGVSHGLLGAIAYQLVSDQALVGKL